jgi:hypothetical protein
MVCVQWCDLNQNNCPGGFGCSPVAGQDKGVCVVKNGGPQPPPPQQPAPGTLGATCAKHDDCNSKICAVDGNGTRFCTQLCDPNAGCKEGFACVPAGGDKYACTPAAPGPQNPGDGEGSGCAVARHAGAGAWLVLLLVLPLLALLRRRR